MAGVNYLWNPINDNIIEEFDDDGNTIAEYTTEPGLHGDVISQHRNGESRFYHSDGQGNVTSLTDENGNVTDTYAYNAFGEVTERTGNTVNPFQFLGQKGCYRDAETGEYQVRGQVLSAPQGRWLSENLAELFNRFVFAGNNPIAVVAVIGNIWAKEKDPPGGRASAGSVCAVATESLPSKDDQGKPTSPLSDPLFKFNICQARCVAQKEKRSFQISSVQDVIAVIEKGKCCTLYICGHQGGDKGNLGGSYTYGKNDEVVFILGPKAKADDVKKFRDAFILNGCTDCAINLFTCGGIEYTKEETAIVTKNRQAIADATGCQVCGTTRGKTGPLAAVGKDDAGILGWDATCPEDKGRPVWTPECLPSKSPIKHAIEPK